MLALPQTADRGLPSIDNVCVSRRQVVGQLLKFSAEGVARPMDTVKCLSSSLLTVKAGRLRLMAGRRCRRRTSLVRRRARSTSLVRDVVRFACRGRGAMGNSLGNDNRYHATSPLVVCRSATHSFRADPWSSARMPPDGAGNEDAPCDRPPKFECHFKDWHRRPAAASVSYLGLE